MLRIPFVQILERDRMWGRGSFLQEVSSSPRSFYFILPIPHRSPSSALLPRFCARQARRRGDSRRRQNQTAPRQSRQARFHRTAKRSSPKTVCSFCKPKRATSSPLAPRAFEDEMLDIFCDFLKKVRRKTAKERNGRKIW